MCWMLIQRIYHLLENPASAVQPVTTIDAVTESLKGYSTSTILSSHVFQSGGEHGKAIGFHEHAPHVAIL